MFNKLYVKKKKPNSSKQFRIILIIHPITSWILKFYEINDYLLPHRNIEGNSPKENLNKKD